jgi:SAM-dependent MidA family methyltransferase
MQVDWISIARRAEANGLRVAGFTDQHHFLTGIVSSWPELLQMHTANSTALSSRVLADADRKIKRALQTLVHPEMLGRAFQVLALAKNVESGAPPLSGFKFAREARSALKAIQ